jgi:hypothetical protein
MSLLLLFNQYEAPITGTAAGGNAPQMGAAFGRVQTNGGGGTAGSGSGTAQQLRTYGRVGQVNGLGGTWQVVTTDANGFNDAVYLTTICQVLKLARNEDPFFANYGIPAQQSVISQTFPDLAAAQTQTQFAPFFASLVITRVQGSNPPVYNVSAVSHSGAIIPAFPVPT